MSHIMYLSPSPIHERRHLAPSSGPIIPSRRHRKGPNEHLQASTRSRKRNRHTPRIAWDRDERDDGRRLASDPSVTLPGERRSRVPRLERQGAFCAPPNWDVSDTDVILDDIALYQLGILYDDEDKDESTRRRGSGFCLDTIVHDEPVYSVRPTKRAKKTHDRRPLSKKKAAEEEEEEEERDLQPSSPVKLQFTYLVSEEDSATAHFLTTPPTSDDEGCAYRCAKKPNYPKTKTNNHFTMRRKTGPGSGSGSGSTNTLAIIYELAESSMFFNNNNKHVPSSPAAAANDFPELISDTEGGESEDHDGDDDGDRGGRPGDDWALVSSPLDDNHNNNYGGGGGGGGGDDVDDDADTIDTTWVYIAEDDS